MMSKSIPCSILLLLFLLFSAHTLFSQYGVETNPITKKKGLVDPEDGRKIIPFEFEDVQPWYGDTLVTVTKGKLKGLYGGKSGQLILPVSFDEIDLSWQTGNKLGYAGVKKDGKLGLFLFNGKQVLLIQYDYVRAVFADLLVAREPGDTVLQFFDASGKPIFKSAGSTAWPGFDNSTTEIIRADKSRYFRNKKGQAVFTENATHGRWTHGKVVMCATVMPGKIINYGFLSWSGDTLLPCMYDQITPAPPNRFMVKTTSNQVGLVNEQGDFILPLETGSLYREGNVFVRRYPSRQNGAVVYDTNGKILLENISLQHLQREFYYLSNLPPPDEKIYFLAFKEGDKMRGIFDDDCRMVVPIQYKHIQYVTDKYALLTYSDDGYTAWRFDGKQALPGRYKHLVYALDPRVLWGIPEGGEKWGFVHLDKPSEATYTYDAIYHNNQSNYFAVMEGDKYFLHNPSGKRINKEAFTYIGSVRRAHFEAWRAAGKKGKLVAQGTRTEEYGGPWVGFDEKGKAYEFKAAEDVMPEMHDEAPMMEEIIPTGKN